MSEIGNKISQYYKSFSGTDTLAFILMPGCTPVVLGSLTTISYSMFRNKKPVINIGRTNINGVTRGSRIYAGTMIFTLINQHWLREIREQIDYLKDFEELKVDELPLFDIMIVSANEYGNAVSMYIFGIDFTDEAQTISVEDLFTENTFSFVARDISNFKSITKTPQTFGKSHTSNKLNDFSQRLYVLASSVISFDELGRLEAAKAAAIVEEMKRPQTYSLTRTLYLNTSRMMIGNDVATIQTLLSRVFPDISINGIFDSEMENYVRKYQSMIGADINGIVDDRIYNSLLNINITPLGTRLGIVVNKNGTFAYRECSINSNVQYTFGYKSHIGISKLIMSNLDGYQQRWYLTTKGYVIADDIYSALDENDVVEFPTIKYGDSSVYVHMIQSALEAIYTDYTHISGIMDEITVAQIKTLQREHGLVDNGEVNTETWLLLQTLAGNIKEMVKDNFEMTFTMPPEVYTVKNKTLVEDLSTFRVVAACKNKINVKVSVVLYFPNGKTITKSENVVVQDKTEISLSSFKSAFIYNPEQWDCPSKVEWIIYPYNKQPYKWIINYAE